MPSNHGGCNGKTATVIGDASYDFSRLPPPKLCSEEPRTWCGRGSRAQTNSERKVKGCERAAAFLLQTLERRAQAA